MIDTEHQDLSTTDNGQSLGLDELAGQIAEAMSNSSIEIEVSGPISEDWHLRVRVELELQRSDEHRNHINGSP